MSIVDKVRELQAAIRERFGVEANIDITICGVYNPRVNRELAAYIGEQIAAQVGENATIAHEDGEKYRWVRVDTPMASKFNFSVFYPEEEIQDETLRTRD